MRLKELRTARKLSQKQLADIIGTTARAISFYETGLREPNIKTLIALADFFEVSLDFLTGRSDDH